MFTVSSDINQSGASFLLPRQADRCAGWHSSWMMSMVSPVVLMLQHETLQKLCDSKRLVCQILKYVLYYSDNTNR